MAAIQTVNPRPIKRSTIVSYIAAAAGHKSEGVDFGRLADEAGLSHDTAAAIASGKTADAVPPHRCCLYSNILQKEKIACDLSRKQKHITIQICMPYGGCRANPDPRHDVRHQPADHTQDVDRTWCLGLRHRHTTRHGRSVLCRHRGIRRRRPRGRVAPERVPAALSSPGARFGGAAGRRHGAGRAALVRGRSPRS